MKAVTATKTSALLSLLFLVVYGGCNWITAQRTDVGTLCFEWERHIPFLPWMIVPYMSIDLFFIAAPFLCRAPGELRAFARRVSFAIVVAGACFLVCPFRFAFARPQVDGWLGAVFNGFRQMDQPFNLLPSLHITLRTILAALYAQHTRGVARAVSHLWFSLIGFSTLFTYQHHVLDVLGGFGLAVYCFRALPDSPSKLPVNPNRRVGSYYALGAVAAGAAAAALRPWGALLLWPALALGIVAGAYFGWGPGICQKKGGRLPLGTRWALAPYLLGQWLSLLHYRRQGEPWNTVVPGVWIGRRLDDREAAEAVQRGVTAVLDLTAEFSEALPFLALRYLNVPILDLTAPTAAQMRQVAAFIAEYHRNGVVFVHCKIGYSRSAVAVGAFLLATRQTATPEEAIALLRRVRPSIVVRPEARAALHAFAETMAASQNRTDGAA